MEVMTRSRARIQHLTAEVGAEARDVDLEHLDDETFERIHKAFFDRTMLVIRRTEPLGPDAQLAFTRRWGEVYITPYVKKLDGYPEILPVVNWGKAKTVTEAWHSDATFQSEPPGVAILTAQTLPAAGGDTMFANCCAAYDALSETMKRMLEGLRAVHVDTVLAKFAGIEDPNAKPQSHPVIRTHPVTGRKSIFVNPLFTQHFDGMSREESKGLLEFLFSHLAKHEFVYRHRWQQGDIVMWDNRCTIHYAVHDYGDEKRVLHRTTIAGGKPA
jgi:taurine dioxygenase